MPRPKAAKKNAARPTAAKPPEAPPAAPVLAIEYWPLERLKPYEKNPRLNDKAVPRIVASIREFGFAVPILARADGEVIDGHLRLKGAIAEKLATVPVIPCDGWSDAQVKAFRLMVNRSVSWADWDTDALALEFAELKALDFDLTLTGFDQKELVSFMASTSNEAEDDVPPVPETPVSRAGDLWVLGSHRLLCGDSTNAADVERLMDGKKAGLMNTDPPYGVGYANDERPHPGVAKPRVAKDELRDEGLQRFLESAFAAAKSVLIDNAAWYLWHAHLTQGFFAAAAAAAAAHVILHRQIIWVKPVLLLGRGQYHWKHEPCFMGWVEGHQPVDLAERNQTTVWEINGVTQAERAEFNHSTPKPVELFRRPILKHLEAGKICYEPFAGSGPQFIAAELTDRICYGLEIAPPYVDVIVARWQTLTSKDATLEGDGRTFSQIAAERLKPNESAPAPNTSRAIKGKRV